MSEPPHVFVLVIGRDSEHLSVLSNTLETLGCTVFRARGVEDWVVPLIRRVPVYLVFFDVEAESGTYAGLLAALGAEDRATKVVVTSRLGLMSDYLEAMQRGAYDFLCPPMDERDLIRLINNSQPSSSYAATSAQPNPRPAAFLHARR
jgi:DNA-binding NtrC family response regulator